LEAVYGFGVSQPGFALHEHEGLIAFGSLISNETRNLTATGANLG